MRGAARPSRARQADGTRTERAARFFNAYLRVAIPAIVGLYLRYGIALEAHQQNTFVVISEAGMPERLVVRDFGDVKIALLDRLGYDGWVGCEYKPQAGTLAGLGWRP